MCRCRRVRKPAGWWLRASSLERLWRPTAPTFPWEKESRDANRSLAPGTGQEQSRSCAAISGRAALGWDCTTQVCGGDEGSESGVLSSKVSAALSGLDNRRIGDIRGVGKEPSMKPDRELLRSLPKVLLHEHLDGVLRPQTVIDLAKDARYAELPTADPEVLAQWF